MFKGDRNFSVGLFVSIAIAAFVAFVIWLTGRGGDEDTTRYSLMFTRDVSGLAVGGPVKYMGMNVGSVIHMSLDAGDGVRVRVDIEVLASTPVNQGTYASLALQGITGVAVVNLASEPGEHPPLASPPRGDYPEIPVRDVGFVAVLSSAPEIMNKLDSLLSQAGELLGEENRGKVSTTLQNVQDLSGSLADSRESLAQLPGELEQTLNGIQSAVGQLQGLVDSVQPDLESTMDSLAESSANLASITGRFDELMRAHEGNIDQFMAEGLGEAPELLRESREALRDLQKLLAELKDDPSQFIHRPPSESLEMDP